MHVNIIMKGKQAMTSFGRDYANFYDYLYQDKDYEKECEFLETIFSKLSFKVNSILDLGCGTGGHSKILSERGYQVVGIDRSKNMIDIANKKIKGKNLPVKFIKRDINNINLNEKFDVIISMFSVVGYQTTNNTLAKFLKTAKKYLNSRGALIFDCWYGPAVLFQKPNVRVKEVRLNSKKRIIRFTEPVLNVFEHTIEIRFKLWNLCNDKLVSETNESHLMRFFFPQEIRYYLELAGFKEIKFLPFLEPERELTELDWNIFVVAKR